MKIAFTSCFNIRQFPSQPVWGRVLAHQPQALVLLGDSVYSDWTKPIVNGRSVSVKTLSTLQFRHHMHALYHDQLHEPYFSALVRAVPQSFAIWDDHDFLWNNVKPGELGPSTDEKIHVSWALLKAFRQALAKSDPDQFPPSADDPALNPASPVQPIWASHVLAHDVVLHLCDTRSSSSPSSRLSMAQRSYLEAAIEAHPSAVHLIASGVVLKPGFLQEGWGQDSEDLHWLEDLGQRHRVLVLSGDIHYNKTSIHDLANQRCLFEATASGAAVKPPLTIRATGNYGILDIQADTIEVQCFSNSIKPQDRLRIHRPTWQALT